MSKTHWITAGSNFIFRLAACGRNVSETTSSRLVGEVDCSQCVRHIPDVGQLVTAFPVCTLDEMNQVIMADPLLFTPYHSDVTRAQLLGLEVEPRGTGTTLRLYLGDEGRLHRLALKAVGLAPAARRSEIHYDSTGQLQYADDPELTAQWKALVELAGTRQAGTPMEWMERFYG